MAAYGALVSVMQIIDQLHHHPHPPISIRKEHVESLTANVTFLQEFLESHNPHVSYSAEADPLESRIAESAYAAEDVIESYIVDQIHARSSDHVEEISSTQFYQGLEKVIEEMDLIKIEAKKKMKEEKNMGVQIIKKSLTNAASFRSSSNAQKVGMVGFDDVLNQMLDKLTREEHVRQIIPIVGMGGLGLWIKVRRDSARTGDTKKSPKSAEKSKILKGNAQPGLMFITGQVGYLADKIQMSSGADSECLANTCPSYFWRLSRLANSMSLEKGPKEAINTTNELI